MQSLLQYHLIQRFQSSMHYADTVVTVGIAATIIPTILISLYRYLQTTRQEAAPAQDSAISSFLKPLMSGVGIARVLRLAFSWDSIIRD